MIIFHKYNDYIGNVLVKKLNLRNDLFHICNAKPLVTTLFINNVCICYLWKNDIITIFMMAKEIQIHNCILSSAKELCNALSPKKGFLDYEIFMCFILNQNVQSL